MSRSEHLLSFSLCPSLLVVRSQPSPVIVQLEYLQCQCGWGASRLIEKVLPKQKMQNPVTCCRSLCSAAPSGKFAMGRQVYFGLLTLVVPLIYLGSTSAAAWLSPQSHFSSTGSHQASIPQHFEAYIINDLKTDTCVYVSFGTTQPHKELTNALGRGGLYHTERSIFDSGRARQAGKLERIRVFSNDTRVLRDYSAALCSRGDHIGTFPVYNTLPREGRIGEGVAVSEEDEGDVPPLEIRPIFQSGDPKNRIDLVF